MQTLGDHLRELMDNLNKLLSPNKPLPQPVPVRDTNQKNRR